MLRDRRVRLLRWFRYRRAPLAHRIGRRGEWLAARWLKRRGFCIRARRWRTPAGEVDLLAERGCRLWLIEVKTTTRARGPSPALRLRAAQRQRLIRTARWTAHQRATRGQIVGIAVVGVRLGSDGSGVVFQTVVYDAANRR